MGEGERGGENKGVGIIWNVAYSAGLGGAIVLKTFAIL